MQKKLGKKEKRIDWNNDMIREKLQELMNLGYDGIVFSGIIRGEGQAEVETIFVNVCSSCDLPVVVDNIKSAITKDCGEPILKISKE